MPPFGGMNFSISVECTVEHKEEHKEDHKEDRKVEHKERIIVKDIRRIINTVKTSEHKIQEGENDIPCQICFENTVECALIPCGHKNSCVSCLRNLHDLNCPICNTKITDVLHIFS